MGLDILVFWDKLIDRWETRMGLLMTFVFIICLYFFGLKFFEVQISSTLYLLVLPILILILVFITWIVSTNRLFFRNSRKIYVGVIMIFDEEKDRVVINKIVRKVIAKINQSDEFNKNLKLKLLPSNFCAHESQINRYHENFYFMYDLMIRVFVESGNYESIEKIVINKFSVTFRRNSTSWKKRIFYDTIDLTKDMGLLIQSRDWDYVDSNSGFDKKKYLNNFHNVILYYTTFYAIYSNRREVALNILTALYDNSKTIVKIKKREGDKVTFELAPFQMAEARLATILIDLYFDSAIESYHKNDILKAISRLQPLKKLALAPNKRFDLYINLARWNYEIGNLDKAIDYTNRAKSIAPNTVQVYLNLGFFAILNDDIKGFYENFEKLHTIRSNPVINWVDVVDFQYNQLEKFPSKKDFFNFSIAFIEYVFIDQSYRNKFENISHAFEFNERFQCLYKLGKYVLSQPYTLTANNIPRKQRRKEKGNKRKRRY